MKVRHIFGFCLVLAAVCSVSIAQSEEEYFAVFIDGKKAGYAVRNRTAAEGKVTTTEKVNITLSRTDIPVTMNTSETSIETTSGKPLGFEAVQDMSVMSMKVTGTVNQQGMVNLTVASMGKEEKSTLEWPKGAVMAEGLRLLELKSGLKEGSSYTVRIFNPSLLDAIDAQVSVGPRQNIDLLGRVVALTEIKTTISMPEAGDIVGTDYVDENLRLQKSLMPVAGLMVEMIACGKEFAMGGNDVPEIVEKMFIKSPVPLEDVGSAKSITYHLIAVPGVNSLRIPSNDNQSVRQNSDGSLTVIVEPVKVRSGGRFPYRGSDKAILEAMQPSRYVQSDRKEIIELAKLAVGDSKDALDAAEKIESFVAGYIENKSLSVGYASAAEVAASRQGDCSEFAVLTAALCRAVGIPAQVVVGIAYVDEFGGMENGFGGHAWVQAYIGGKWVGLDATFKSTGRGGYDAGHIALAAGNGDPKDFFNLATTIGQFKIDRIKVDTNSAGMPKKSNTKADSIEQDISEN